MESREGKRFPYQLCKDSCNDKSLVNDTPAELQLSMLNSLVSGCDPHRSSHLTYEVM